MKRVNALISTVAMLHGHGAFAQDWNVDLFFGPGANGSLVWDGISYATDGEIAFGIGLSLDDVLMPNLEIGLELSRTKSTYTVFDPNNIVGEALMLTARYNFFNSGGFEAYGGAGLGAVQVTYSLAQVGGYSNTDTVAGGQIMLGGRYRVGANSQLLLEARMLDTFEDPIVALSDASAPAEFDSTNVMIGFRQSF